MARNMRIKQSLVLLSQVLKNCCINAACFLFIILFICDQDRFYTSVCDYSF